MLWIWSRRPTSIAKVPNPVDDWAPVRRRAVEKGNRWALCHRVLVHCLAILRLNTGNGNRIAHCIGTTCRSLNGQANGITAIGSIGMLWRLLRRSSTISEIPAPPDNVTTIGIGCIIESNCWALLSVVAESCVAVLGLNTSNCNRIAVGIGATLRGCDGQAYEIIAIGSISMLWIRNSCISTISKVPNPVDDIASIRRRTIKKYDVRTLLGTIHEVSIAGLWLNTTHIDRVTIGAKAAS